MKIFYRFLLVFGIFGILFFNTISFAQNTLTFPTTPPVGQVQGGYFKSYFNNMFSGNGICPEGEVLVGFSTGATSNVPYAHDQKGQRICKRVDSDGLAKGFTGSMVGSTGYIPVYVNGGKTLSTSWLSQIAGGIRFSNPFFDTNNASTVSVIQFEDKNNKDVGTIGKYSVGSSKFFGVNSWGDYIPSLAYSSDRVIKAFIGIKKDGNVYIGRNSQSTQMPRAQLDVDGDLYVNGPITIKGGNPGDGKVLVSNSNGQGSWSSLAEAMKRSFPELCQANGRSLCYGTLALQNNTANGSLNTAIGHSSMEDNTTGSENVALGFQSLWSNTTGNYNIAIGNSALSGISNGNNNIGIGRYSGGSVHGDNNIFIGNDVGAVHGPNYVVGNKQLNIGNWITGVDGNIAIGLNPRNASANDFSKAKLSVNGKIRITDGTQGSGKILMSDADGVARWEKAEFGASNNPNNCTEAEKFVAGITYRVIALTNGNSYIATAVKKITGGQEEYKQEFRCDTGKLIAVNSPSKVTNCIANGYSFNGTSCVQPQVIGVKDAPCGAKTVTINGHDYQVAATNHNFSYLGYSTSPIENGYKNYKQLFACDNGAFKPSGAEEMISITCLAGYAYNGNNCEKSDIDPEIYKDTTCATANIQVVKVTPGTDKLPYNLAPNTSYQLSPGTYDITRQVNMNECTSIVGTGKTPDEVNIRYAGASYGEEQLITSQYDYNVIYNLKLTGQIKDRPGRAKHLIYSKDNNTGNKRVVRKVNFEKATDYSVKGGSNGLYEKFNIKDSGGFEVTSATIRDVNIGGITNKGTFFKLTGGNNNIKNITLSGVFHQIFSFKHDYNTNSYNCNDYYIKRNSNNSLSNINIYDSTTYSIFSGIISTVDNLNLKNSIWTGFNNNKYNWSYLFDACVDNISNIIFENITSATNDTYISNSGRVFSISKSSNVSNIKVKNVVNSYSYSDGSALFFLLEGNVNFNNIYIENYTRNNKQLIKGNYNFINNLILTNATEKKGFNNIIHDSIVGDKNTLNNLIISNSSKVGLELSGSNNILRNVVSYANAGDGIVISGNNNVLSNVYSYANTGDGIKNTGQANYYFDTLKVFDNGGTNNAGGLNRGTADKWLGVFGNGTLYTNETFGDDWVVNPNIPGFNPKTRGYQDVTFPENVNYTFGKKIPYQIAPILPSDCILSATSNTKCKPTVGGTDTYNATKKIGQQ